jgi:hypothetical protein
VIDPDLDSDEFRSLDDLRQYATNFIYVWFGMQGQDSGAADEGYEITRSGMSHADATRALRLWFHDRLLVDQGTPDPFSHLLSALVGAMLDLVDWDDVVGTMRRREE